ncbi:MAG TPA: SCO6880 family protein [Acidimicrobiales bacterium]|nr:SCO6880 family protein [Acidimicrobiales bacterium]
MADARAYQFAPRDATGWLLGLSGGQCLSLAAAGIAASACLWAALPLAVAVVFVAAGVAASFIRVSGMPTWDAVAAVLALARNRRQPVGRRALISGDIHIVEMGVPWSSTPIAVTRSSRHASASLRVRGRSFALAEAADQDRLLAAWGAALGAFCVDGSPVARVVVTCWSGPTAPSSIRVDGPAAYRALVQDAGRSFTTVEVIVTVIIDTRRVRGSHPDRVERAVAEELRLFIQRLELAGLDATPLGRRDVHRTVDQRLQPSPPERRLSRTLADITAHGEAELTDTAEWISALLGEHHRAWEVTEWPRAGVHAAWLESLLVGAAGTRTFSVSLTPVPPRVSRRRVDREAVRLATDRIQRDRAGFRVSHRSARAAALLDAREAELVDGYGEVSFAAILTATAPTPEQLSERSSELEAAAARCGLELRRLDGRHHLAVAATLPLPADVVDEGWWA